MKKSLLFAVITLILVLLSACSREKETASVSEVSTTTTPKEANTVEATITYTPSSASEFTEGVLIKKYPGDYACVSFETADGFQILSDPYMLEDILSPDIVTESHQDGDHNDTSQVEGAYTLITEPGEYPFDEAVIRGYPGFHNKGQFADPNNIFVINMGNITIAHFASQGDIPSDEVLNQIGKIDVLLIQVFENGSYGKLLPDDLPPIIDKLQPKIIIPEHGQSNADAVIAKKLNITSEAVPSGSLILTRTELDLMTESKVINLDNETEE